MSGTFISVVKSDDRRARNHLAQFDSIESFHATELISSRQLAPVEPVD
jgi:hypothetical protein